MKREKPQLHLLLLFLKIWCKHNTRHNKFHDFLYIEKYLDGSISVSSWILKKRIHTVWWDYRFCAKQPACWISVCCPFGYLDIGSCPLLRCVVWLPWYDVCPFLWSVSWFAIWSQNLITFCRHRSKAKMGITSLWMTPICYKIDGSVLGWDSFFDKSI